MRRLFLLTILFTHTLSMTSLAQVEKVNVSFSEKPLDEILKEITRKHHQHFSYDQQLPLLKLPITIEAKDLPLNEFLKTLFEKAGVDYKVIDGHIAITGKSEPIPPAQRIKKRTDPNAVKRKQSETSNVDIYEQGKVTQLETVTQEKVKPSDQKENTPVQKNTPLQQNPSVKVNSVEAPIEKEAALIEKVETSIDKEPTAAKDKVYLLGDRLSIGITGSLDSYHFSKPTFEGSRSSFTKSLNFSAGIAAHYDINHKWFIETQVRLARRNFDMNYNFQIIDSGDPYVLDKTSFRLTYLNIPVNVNYRFLKKGNFSFYARGGMGIDLLIADELTTLLKDGSETTTPAHFGNVNQFVFAMQAGVNAQYHFNEKWKLNFSPIYRTYLIKFNDSVEGIGVQTISMELGIVYRL